MKAANIDLFSNWRKIVAYIVVLGCLSFVNIQMGNPGISVWTNAEGWEWRSKVIFPHNKVWWTEYNFQTYRPLNFICADNFVVYRIRRSDEVLLNFQIKPVLQIFLGNNFCKHEFERETLTPATTTIVKWTQQFNWQINIWIIWKIFWEECFSKWKTGNLSIGIIYRIVELMNSLLLSKYQNDSHKEKLWSSKWNGSMVFYV